MFDAAKLRSARRLFGFRVQAMDGDVGKVADVLYGPEPRRISRLVVATRGWPPGSKLAMPTEHIQGISRPNR
ncbi:MAG: hypothetical protein JXO22_09710 [Phycisphaerae bacterium]|nr:hypothetical protein [Phycisphaerae bacterium]